MDELELLIRMDERLKALDEKEDDRAYTNTCDHKDIKEHLDKLNGQVATNTKHRHKLEGSVESKLRASGKIGGIATVIGYIAYDIIQGLMV